MSRSKQALFDLAVFGSQRAPEQELFIDAKSEYHISTGAMEQPSSLFAQVAKCGHAGAGRGSMASCQLGKGWLGASSGCFMKKHSFAPS